MPSIGILHTYYDDVNEAFARRDLLQVNRRFHPKIDLVRLPSIADWIWLRGHQAIRCKIS